MPRAMSGKRVAHHQRRHAARELDGLDAAAHLGRARRRASCRSRARPRRARSLAAPLERVGVAEEQRARVRPPAPRATTMNAYARRRRRRGRRIVAACDRNLADELARCLVADVKAASRCSLSSRVSARVENREGFVELFVGDRQRRRDDRDVVAPEDVEPVREQVVEEAPAAMRSPCHGTSGARVSRSRNELEAEERADATGFADDRDAGAAARRSASRSQPSIARARSKRLSSRYARSAATPAAIASGWPLNVWPLGSACSSKCAASDSRTATPPSGTYADVTPLANVKMSGVTPKRCAAKAAPGAAEAGHHLVEDQQDAVAVAEFAHACQIAVGIEMTPFEPTTGSISSAAMRSPPS